MTAAAATAAAMAAATTHLAGRSRAGGASGGKGGKLLRQLFRTAMRAFGILPIAGADQQLAIFSALFTMKFVYRHKKILMQSIDRDKKKHQANTRENSQRCFIGNFLRFVTQIILPKEGVKQQRTNRKLQDNKSEQQ
ncbi:MAG TPA: hypothetical protein VMH87_13660 [Pseudomonadales bacterium]|nr:hypothetical protein [Pseudomonadales bacterium]